MEQAAIFYGPAQGSVAKVAHMASMYLGTAKIDMHWVGESTEKELEAYSHIIMGISTIGRDRWDSDYTDDEWDLFEVKLKNVNWQGRKVAIYCLGNQVAYPNNFVDALGWLYERLSAAGAEVVGQCPIEGYVFNGSEGVMDGRFIGLPLDEDTQAELTQGRLEKWLEGLKEEGF